MEQSRNTSTKHFEIKGRKEVKKGTAAYHNNSSKLQKNEIYTYFTILTHQI
jgi:hypothetical protein